MDKANPYRKELEDMDSPLADMPREMPFQLPPGYFRKTLSEALHPVTDINPTAASDPVAEIRSLSPLLAEADRTMPFTTPPDFRMPATPASAAATAPTLAGPQIPARRTPIHRLTALRTAAAILLVGTAAVLLRLQTSTQNDLHRPTMGQSLPVDIDSLDAETLDAFLDETDGGIANTAMDVDSHWPDDLSDALLGRGPTLDSSLSTLPEATLLAYAQETNPAHLPQP